MQKQTFHKFLIGVGSRLWLGHSDPLTHFYVNHYIATTMSAGVVVWRLGFLKDLTCFCHLDYSLLKAGGNFNEEKIFKD